MLQAMFLLPLFWAGLRVLGFSRLQRWAVSAPVCVGARAARIQPAGIGALVNVAGNQIPFPSTCLSRSMLLVWLLRRRGVTSELHIGVRKVAGGIESHAWAVRNGIPVNDTATASEQCAVFDLSLSA